MKAATWLPPELSVVQPYSMGPVTNWDPIWPVGSTLPAMGTILQCDDQISTGRRGLSGAEFAILGVFVAPAAIQRAAQAQGERGIIMARPRGLIEALGGHAPHAGVGADTVRGRKAQRAHAALKREMVEVQEAGASLADLLADDDD